MPVGSLGGFTTFSSFSCETLRPVEQSGWQVASLNLALIGNVARMERRLHFVEVDALLILLLYLGGMGFLTLRSMG